MKTLLLLVLSYLIGSILSGVWIGKIFYHVDIREHGSGNTGTTNTFRVLGKKAGIVVLLLDILKGTLATCLPLIFGLAVPQLWCGLAAVLGHTFPIYARFKGGKAVATSAGMLLGYSPVFFLYAAAVFTVSLFITSMVSLSSMLTAVLVTLSTIILPFAFPSVFPPFNWLLTLIALFLTLFIFYRHKDNIKRIKEGNENKVPFGLNKKKQ